MRKYIGRVGLAGLALLMGGGAWYADQSKQNLLKEKYDAIISAPGAREIDPKSVYVVSTDPLYIAGGEGVDNPNPLTGEDTDYRGLFNCHALIVYGEGAKGKAIGMSHAEIRGKPERLEYIPPLLEAVKRQSGVNDYRELRAMIISGDPDDRKLVEQVLHERGIKIEQGYAHDNKTNSEVSNSISVAVEDNSVVIRKGDRYHSRSLN